MENGTIEIGSLIVSLAIVALSLTLFVYWFRYSCILILNARGVEGAELAETNGGRRLEEMKAVINGGLGAGESEDLLERLDRDYERVRELYGSCSRLKEGYGAVEAAMLAVDYRVMKVFAVLGQLMFPGTVRDSLLEMCEIVRWFSMAAMPCEAEGD